MMLSPRRSLLVLAASLTLALITITAAAGQDLTLRPGVEAHAGIDAIYGKFTQAYKDLDPARVASLYTTDALYLSPGEDVLQGRGAIEQNFASAFTRAWDAGERLHIRFEILDRGIDGKLGYDVGYYHLKRVPKEGEVHTSTGKFTVVIRCEGKEGPCLFHVDSYSGLPRPEPEPAAEPEPQTQPDPEPDSAEP